MKVVCCGPESSGTRLVARIVNSMGAEAVHRSIPNGPDWEWHLREHYDAAIVIVRDFLPTCISQVHVPHSRDASHASAKVHKAIGVIAQLPYPWWLITYENLVARPAPVVREIANFLKLEPPGEIEPIVDGNPKWYQEAGIG